MEREMTRHQRGLVDTCFEEGQFEAAIVVLDQLRSSQHRPAGRHIHQLLYIALYPPQTDYGAEIEYGDPMSPRRAAKHQKNSLFPSPAAALAAQRLLMSLTRTNTPSGLFHALPSYSNTHVPAGNALVDGEEDSVIGKEAACIKESKNCWAILKEGFIQRKLSMTSLPVAKGKGRLRDVHDSDGTESLHSREGSPSIVAANAWPVLDWILTILELDECEQLNNDFPRFSPLLLTQIPSPRGGTEARWEVDVPLEICFYCFQQSDQEQKSMGARLLSLLINLTATIYLDMAMFVAAVYTRISAFQADALAAFFSRLTPSVITCKFKVAVCQKFIMRASSVNNPGATDLRPKPQARAQPRSTATDRQRTRQVRQASSAVSDSTASIASKHPPPTMSEIMRLLDTHKQRSEKTDANQAFTHMKFELVHAFGHLQTSVAAEERDSDWAKALHNGILSQALNNAFGQDNDGYGFACLGALSEMLSIWRVAAEISD